jgi:hypothetical protein
LLPKASNISGLRVCLLVFLFAFSITGARAQFFDLPVNKKKITVPFKMVRNMVIVKTKIDGKGPFNFIIDSGVGIIIITDPGLADSVGLQSRRTIKLSGLGSGEDFDATITSNLSFDLDGIKGNNMSAAILRKDRFGLSNYAGMPIHGLIGYDFFNSLAVKFNFYDSTLTVARPGYLKEFKKGFRVPISIEQGKPYINARIKLDNQHEINAKLVVDIGAGHPLMLDNQVKNNTLPQKFIVGNLGVGLTGPVTGLISRVNEIDIGKYPFKNVITSFTLTDTSTDAARAVPRDGNLGLGILKRFMLIIDYQNSAMFLQPAKDFKAPFEHDMSGLEYYADGDNYRTIIINRVEPGSAGDITGLQKDDAILNINFKPVADMTIQEIDDIFKSGADRSLILDIYRDKKRYRYIITLKRRL